MAAVLTRILEPARRRFLRQSDASVNSQSIVSPKNKRAFEHNAQADVSTGDALDEDATDQPAEAEDDADEDPDAEGSPDVEDYPIQIPTTGEVEEDDDAYEEKSRRTIKVRRTSGRTRARPARRRKDSTPEEDGDEEGAENDSDSDEEEEEEEGVAPWEAESEEEEEVEETAQLEVHNPNRCYFCKQDEDDDPSPEFEEYLTCTRCSDHAHRSCAREEKSLSADEDATAWRCPHCVSVEDDVDGQDEHDTASDAEPQRRRRSSSKLTRELQPVLKPGAHTVFANVIFDEEEDGSRPLRKRKTSTTSTDEKPQLPTRKRRKREVSTVDADQGLSVIGEGEGDSLAPSTGRVSRSRQPRQSIGPPFRIVERTEDSFIVSFALPSSLADLEHEWKKAKRRERDQARRARQKMVVAPPPEPDIPHFPGIALSFTAPTFALQERDGEEAKKPYGGILSELEADTTKTFPQSTDRKKFEDARQKAEEEWKKKIEAARAADPSKPVTKASGPPSRIKCINFGKYEVDTWHAAPYPEEYSRNRVLYICEFCLKYMSSDFVAWRHKLKCPSKHPPGDEIYRDGNFSFFEVDGRKNPVYCQNLCLLAKLFLGSKTLYYDVEPFLFYIMTEHDEYGEHFVGYFSKEKRPSSLNNVSCILVLPVHQRRGFGHMLIEFSYLLTKVEKRTGSPEKPLSDMGLVSYRSYWRLVLCKEMLVLHEAGQPISVTELSLRTGMTADDIVSCLEGLRALVRDPVTKTYALRLDLPYYRQYIDNYEKKGYTKIEADSLIWVPYVMGKDNMHYENTPQLTTVKQREEPEETIAAFEATGPSEEGVQQDLGMTEAESFIVAAEDAADDPTGGAVLDDGPPIDPALLALDVAMPTAAALPITTSAPPPPAPIHPFPSLDLTTPSKPRSPPPHPVLTNGTSHHEPATSTSASPIPATRFEVFPALPGMQPKRKAGRPLGRGARARLAAGLGTRTPSRRGSMQSAAATPATASASVRRTRSNLVVEEAMAPENMQRSGRGLRRGRSQVGVEDAVVLEESVILKEDEDNLGEASVEPEVDAEGEADEDEDPDAEGEVDDEMDVDG